jgi:hypothetical protein
VAQLFVEGFDQYGTDATLPAGYWTTYDSTAKSLVAGRFGDRALQVTANNTISRDIGVNAATLIIGFAFKITSLPGTVFGHLCSVMDNATLQCGLYVDPGGHLQFRNGNGGTLLASSSSALSTGVWYYGEIKVKVDGSAGTVEVRINGSSSGWIPPTSSLNTRSTTNNYANRIALQSAGTGIATTVAYDDLYVLDTTGSAPLNDFLGGPHVSTKFPSGNGSTNQWTATGEATQAQCVDNNPPNDAVYSGDSTVGHRDLYAFADTTGQSIYSVTQLIRAVKSDAGSRSINPVCKSGGTTSVGGTIVLGTSPAYVTQLYTTDPNTGAAWTEGAVSAAEFGQDTV